MRILKPESMVFAFNLFIFSSNTRKDVGVDIPKAVLIFLPIVFSHAGRSAAALDLLSAGSFRVSPQLQRQFPQENWDQLFWDSYKACKLAIAAPEDDGPTIPESDAEIRTSSRGSCLEWLLRVVRIFKRKRSGMAASSRPNHPRTH